MTERYLVVGLGNPGREYKKNRHNIGFQIVDFFAARHGLEFTRQQSNAVIASGTIAGRPVTLAKPMTFMNASGGPVSALMKFYKIEVDHLLVIADDLDLPVGTIRLKPEGGSGGQNGLKDIINRIGTKDFARMRMGVGRPPGKMDAAAYVLQDFNAEQQAIIDETYQRAANAVETWLSDGITLAMSRHNAPAEQV